ncbi:MAG: phosphoenolpyruvate synthase [Magnetococcales bacterium]|nr:phosphoenolpyruvate synthase [Magnetococcales bacterium]
MTEPEPDFSRSVIRSQALSANLEQTRVSAVTIAREHEILREVVAHYRGIQESLDRLLSELNHPFRNWTLILPELRGYALKNMGIHLRHERGPEGLRLLCRLFLQASTEGVRTDLSRPALEALSAVLARAIDLMPVERLRDHGEAFRDIFAELGNLSRDQLRLLGQSPFSLRRALLALLEKSAAVAEDIIPWDSLKGFTRASLGASFDYWLALPDPSLWASEAREAVAAIVPEALLVLKSRLLELESAPAGRDNLAALLALPDYMEIVHMYHRAAERIDQAGEAKPRAGEDRGEILKKKLVFLFHIMRIDGLRLVHEQALRSINQALVQLIRMRQGFEELRERFDETFHLFREHVASYPHTALQSIEILGEEVFRRDNSRLVEIFLQRTVEFGFQYRQVTGVSAEWQPICNPNHLHNIRVWLGLIRRNPPWSPTLFSALIVNLKLTGVLIRDTDLFQREVTRLLDSGIRPVYNLARQFCRLLPVYYNEIGAEGLLREVSTQLDERHQRKDALIHFLRKQCHVESTNRIVALARGILLYWQDGDRGHLEGLVSDPVFQGLTTGGPLFDEVHRVTQALFAQAAAEGVDPFSWTTAEAERRIMALESGSDGERQRVWLVIHLYHLLEQKYDLGFRNIREPLRQAMADGIPGLEPLDRLLDAQQRGEPIAGDEKLDTLLTVLERLNRIILSDETFIPHEEIYQKRHIAVDIPSVYGRYSEKKFDALSLGFRLENLATVELEALAVEIREEFITRSSFFRVHAIIRFFLRALDLDGVSSRRLVHLNGVLERFLEFNEFTFHQYIDVFQGFAEGIKDLVATYFTTHHRDTLATIIPMIPREALLPKYHSLLDDDPDIGMERISESFLRDLVAETFGLQSFDRFITRLLHLLRRQEERLSLPLLNQLMNFHPGRLFHSLADPRHPTMDLLHLGSKGFNLLDMAADRLPIPAGTVLTTEYFRCREVIRAYPPARKDFMDRLRAHVRLIENQTGRVLGAPVRPLLVSVRSGALFSMPGMMQTIHNVGINQAVVAALAGETGNPFFAWDNYRRFVQSWCATRDMDRAIFTDLMHRHKDRAGIRWKQEFSHEQIRDLALDYLAAAKGQGIVIPEDPMEQLQTAIDQVVDSWSSEKSRSYRRIMDLSDAWGTAVVIQRMVFGNLGRQAGSGVVFTAHPHRKLDRVLLWGDYTTGNQGEDVVNGLVTTRPISLDQCDYEGRDPEISLERCFPEVHGRLHDVATHLIYQRRFNPQELEFTFEGPRADDLYLLQTRDMVTAKNRVPAHHRFQDTPELRESRIARGIGVAGGALCGRAVFNLDQIHRLRAEFGDEPLILIRHDTVPEDIREVSMTQGLLTSRGGQTCHAAIVAAKLARTCVVGCEDLVVGRDSARSLATGREIRCGDPIGVDGARGLLYWGWFPSEK